MNRDEQELELEDQISEEVNDVEEDEVTSDAALLDADGDEDEFVQGRSMRTIWRRGSTKRFRRGRSTSTRTRKETNRHNRTEKSYRS